MWVATGSTTPSWASRVCPWNKGQTGKTVARFAEGADVLAVFTSAEDAMVVLAELTLVCGEGVQAANLHCILHPNGAPAAFFLEPDEKAYAFWFLPRPSATTSTSLSW